MRVILTLLALQILAFVLRTENEFQLYSQDLILESKPLIFGSISKFCPFCGTAQIGEVFDVQEDLFLVFYLQEYENNEIVLFHYLQFDKVEQKIYHILNVKNQGEYQEQKFLMTNIEYEGVWHLFYLYISIDDELIYGYIQQTDKQEYIQTGINLLQQKKYLIVVGGSLKVFKNNEALNLRSFIGRLVYFSDDNLSETDVLNFNFLQNVIHELDECQAIEKNSLKQIQFIPTQFMNVNTEMMQMSAFYFVQFWFKVDQIKVAEHKVQLNVITISVENKLQGIELDLISLSYQKNNQDWFFNFQYQSYEYPYFIGQNEIIINSNINPIDISLIFQWHLIIITYQSSKISLEIFNYESNLFITENQQNIFQYSSYFQMLMIGDSDSTYIQSNIGSLQFTNCRQQLSHFCHFSCQTCFGPLRNNCLSCSEQSNRIYNQLKKTCSCLLFYLDEGVKECKNFDSNIFVEEKLYLPTASSYDKIEPELICSYGYFYYDGECLQCPSASQENVINCPECLQNPKEWVREGFQCNQVFKHSNQNLDNVIEGQSVDLSFLIHNFELTLINNFHKCNQDSLICHQIGYDNQDPLYIECDDENISFFFLNGNCFLKKSGSSISICEKGCKYCFYKQCQYCDTPEYFLSLTDLKCRLCSIANCKYCFEYNIYNHEEVSAKLGMQIKFSPNVEDFVQGCSLCYNNYIFDFTINQCVEKTLQLPCLNGFITEQENFICTSYQGSFQGILQEKQSCIELMPYCLKCIIDKYGMVSCVQCIDGYYLDIFTNICYNCQTLFKNTKSCWMLSIKDDNWKYQVQSFYVNFLPSQTQLLILNGYYHSEYQILQCYAGYYIGLYDCEIPYDKNCLKLDPNYPNNFVCIQCDSSNYDYEVYSYFNKNCQICPYPCSFCTESPSDLIASINSEFILDDNTIQQTHQCLLRSEEREKTYLSTENYNIQQRDSDGLRFKMKIIEVDYSEKLFQKGMTFLDLLIRKKIHTYVAKLNSTKDYLSDTLKKYVFTLQNMTLIYDATNDTNQNEVISMLDFDAVSINNLTFLEVTKRFIISYKKGVSIELNNLSYDSSIIGEQQFLFSNVTNFTIDTMIFRNTKIYNSSFLKIFNLFASQKYILKIKNLQFIECHFLNMTFLALDLQEENFISVNFEHVYFSKCIFNQSSFCSYSSEYLLITQLFFLDLVIEESEFYDSNFFNISDRKQISFQKITFRNIFLNNSNLFLITSSFLIKEGFLQNSVFLNSSFIEVQVVQQFENYDFQLFHIDLENIYFEKKSVFAFDTLQVQNAKIFIFQTIQLDIKSNEGKLCFLSFSGSEFVVQTLNGKNLEEMSNFCIKSISLISLQDVKLMQTKKIQSSITFLVVNDFEQIDLSDFEISQLNISNQYLIKIESLKNINNFAQLKVNINNLNIFNNFLLKQKVNSLVTILSIQSQTISTINIKNLNFTNNIILHSINDQLTNSPGLLMVDCQRGSLIIESSVIESNTIRNSSQSLWLIFVQNIHMNRIVVMNVNQQNQVDGVVYEIQSIGGFSRISTQNLTVSNSYFSNILSQSGSCYYIQMKSSGIITFSNMTILSSFSKTTSRSVAKGGSMYIDCSDSSLTFTIENLTVYNSISENEGGFIYLISSRISNQVILKNINAYDVISPQNSFFQFDCSLSNGENSIQLQNIRLSVKSDTAKSLVIGKKLIDQFYYIQQGFLILVNCNITIVNFIFEGIAYIPLLHIEFSQKITLKNILLSNVQLYGRSLIFILDLNHKVIEQKSEKVRIENLQIHNSTFNPDSKLLFKNYQAIPQSFVTLFIQSTTNKVQIFVNKLLVTKNTCYECSSGLVQFQSQNSYLKMSIQQLHFTQNDCGNLTCLESSLPSAIQMKIKYGQFIQNTGGKGGAIYFEVSTFRMFNLIFLQNQAKQDGGALYIDSPQNLSLNWNEVYFVSNKANFGGAVMLTNARLPINLYKNCQFYFNIAQKQSNSVAEIPSSLQLAIFGYTIETIKSIQKESVHEKPNLDRYQKSNQKIYIPSGQQIGQYQRVSKESLDYVPYDINIRVYAINSLEEKQFLKIAESCDLIISSKTSQVVEYQSIISFSTSNQSESILDLSQLTLVIDPYDSSKNKSLSISCGLINQITYSFTFDVEIFHCQMGEYYYQNQCLLCQAEKGYYSIKKKQQVCIKADPKIIAANKANQVNLLVGYWRSNYESQKIEYCFKRPFACEGGWIVGDSSCQKGNIGALCEECDIYNVYGYGQYYKNQNYECAECGNFIGKMFFTFATTIIMIFSVSLTVNSVFTIFKSFKRLKMASKYYDIIFRRNLDQSAALIKMIVNYFQILVGIHSFRLDMYINFLDFLLPISNPFANSTFSYDCFISLQSKVDILYTSFIIGLIFPTLCFVLYILLYLTSVYLRKITLSSTIYFTALLYLFFYTQPNIIKEIGSLLASRTISEVKYVSKNVSYFFYTETHIKWIFLIIFPFLTCFAFILPLFLLYILVKNRKYQHSEKFRQIWGYLFNDYKKDTYYWEIFKVSFRELIIFILLLIEENVLLKGIIMFLLLLFYYIFAKMKQPYNIGQLNLFEQKNIFICSLVIIFSCLKYQLQQTESQSFDFVIQIIIFLLLLWFLVLLLVKMLLTYYHKLSARFDTLRSFILTKFPHIIENFKFLKSILELHKDKQIRIAKHVSILRNTLRSQRKQQQQQVNSLNVSSFGVPENSSLHSRHISNIFTHNQFPTLINQLADDYIVQ